MDLEAAFDALPGLTEREAQRRMAAAVAEALERQAPLLVHAPTGVGKSLGYLVPIVAAGRRAIVATATKALQSQLVERDLPRLAEAFDTTFALAMGRANYACLARIEALVAATRLAATRTEEAALEVASWALESATGSRLDAPPGVRDDVWDLISTSGEDCPGQKGCPFHSRCFAERAREEARDVDVVVTNHHLLLLELELRAMSDAPGVMLPEVDVIVVDEAHRLADHAADLYGITVTASRMGRAGAAADAAAKAAGLHTDWSRRLRGRYQELSADLYPGPVLPGGRAQATLTAALTPLANDLQTMLATLKDLGDPDDEAAALLAARRRLRALSRDLDRLTNPGVRGGVGRDRPGENGHTRGEGSGRAQAEGEGRVGTGENGRDPPAAGPGDPASPGGARADPTPAGGSPDPAGAGAANRAGGGPTPPASPGAPSRAGGGPTPPASPGDLAVWVEEGRGGARVVRSALVEPGPVLAGVLWERVPAAVACSATLAVAGSLEVAARSLGVADPATVVAASPFDFRRNALLYVPRAMPPPSSDGFQAAAERELVSLVEASRGRALVLCTSWRAVESFAAALANLPYELLVQGDDVPARLAARFRDEVASVLVATRTFFEGFDVPGESLSLLVLDRLPFPRPDDPLLAERGRRVEARGASRFAEVWLPAAAVSLQQALGRLVRSETDRGVMAVLDRRLADAGYRSSLLSSLPPARLTRSLEDVRAFFAV
jgi:ATP-dependent DNA helicase DinG